MVLQAGPLQRVSSAAFAEHACGEVAALDHPLLCRSIEDNICFVAPSHAVQAIRPHRRRACVSLLLWLQRPPLLQGLATNRAKMLAVVPDDVMASAEQLVDDLQSQLEKVQFGIDRQDPDRTSIAASNTLNTVQQLEILQVRSAWASSCVVPHVPCAHQLCRRRRKRPWQSMCNWGRAFTAQLAALRAFVHHAAHPCVLGFG